MPPAAGTAPIRARAVTYLLLLACFAAALCVSHLTFLRLPYYWDEAGQFIPAALDIFRRSPVDVAVLEVGLGGRFDATNIITPASINARRSTTSVSTIRVTRR